MTSEFAAHSVCSLQLADVLAASVGAPLYLHAGSHLGAILHGGPQPWDDDIDAFMPYNKRDEFMRACKKIKAAQCVIGHNALKLSIITPTSTLTRRGWFAPFVDIFLYKFSGLRHIVEVDPVRGQPMKQSFLLAEYFPTRPFYFAGITVLGPRDAISTMRYNLSRCVVNCFHHRLESSPWCKGQYDLNCTELARYFPFVSSDGLSLSSGQSKKALSLPNRQRASDLTSVVLRWNSSLRKRTEWLESTTAEGQSLTDAFPHLNSVEIDNGISKGCASGSILTMVEFNAERGKHWPRIAQLLEPLNADVIILNEMDIGMARSDQQHTAKLLAHALGMNYAWAIEFIELTRGTETEQADTAGSYNFYGLHGNAILSKCPLVNGTVFRDPIGEYFSTARSKLNANGYERRLGGRMGLFARVSLLSGETLAIGSIHKISGQHTDAIRRYIGSLSIVAGDQDWDYCRSVGLAHLDWRAHHTYPASCAYSGRHRGDIICGSSSLKVLATERTLLPCLTSPWGVEVHLSDHALSIVTLAIPAVHH